MGNYQSDQKTSRFFGLKLNKNTDKDLIEHLEQQESIQAYLKRLIRNSMKEEKTMASRQYYRGSIVSDTALENMIANMQETADQDEFDRLADNYRQHMISALEALDDRLWWQPETSEVFWEDNGSDKQLPDPDTFESWWNETTESWIESL